MHKFEASRFSYRNGFSEDLSGEGAGGDMCVDSPESRVLEP